MHTMKLASRQPPRISSLSRLGCVALAIAASGISVLMAATMGSTMGGSSAEQALWAMFGVMPVLGAHWLPAMARSAGPWLRAMAWAMWMVCMAYATYSHASYFLLAQQEAGTRRSGRPTRLDEQTVPSRPLSAILTDEAKVRGELTKATSVTCQDCRWVRGRISEINLKIKALQAEAEEARRDQAVRDHADRLRDQRRADPVTSKLAAWLGTTQGLVALAPALVFAVILDGLASLCWMLATQRRDPPGKEEAQVAVTPVTPITPVMTAMAVTPPGAVSSPPAIAPSAASKVRTLSAKSPPARDFDDLVTSAKEAVMTGQIKSTVTGIREHLRCQQVLARAVRKALSEPTANA